MAKVEFRFIVSDVTLTEADHDKIGRAIAQAGALALAELTPIGAVTVPLRHGVWWQGIPPEPMRKAIEQLEKQLTKAPAQQP